LIELPRELARRLRTVLRGSLLAGEPRGSWPLLLVRAEQGELTLQARHNDLAVRFTKSGANGVGAIAFRSDLLAQFEGRNADPVTLEAVEFGKGTARWTDAGVSRTIEFETVTVDSMPEFPALPKQWSELPPTLLQALAEAAQTTTRDGGRLSLLRVQLRGKAGQVVATDGKQLLVQRGFAFPWADDVLVPRVPAFGSKELAGVTHVEVGRTTSHVAVRTGDWIFLLPIDTTSRYPDVNNVIPRPGSQSTYLHIHPDDAAFLNTTLPKLPGRDDEYSPVTLDLGAQAIVRAQEEHVRATEVVLSCSTVTGPPVRLCLDRDYLARALKLGFRELLVPSPNQPVLCQDQGRLYVFMPLDGKNAVLPCKGMHRLVSVEGDNQPESTPRERRKDIMPAVTPNGRNPDDHLSPQQPEHSGIEEIIVEAEALRVQLQEASVRTSRLIAALKQQRRQSRAVMAAMASLRQIGHLTP